MERTSERARNGNDEKAKIICDEIESSVSVVIYVEVSAKCAPLSHLLAKLLLLVCYFFAPSLSLSASIFRQNCIHAILSLSLSLRLVADAIGIFLLRRYQVKFQILLHSVLCIMFIFFKLKHTHTKQTM